MVSNIVMAKNITVINILKLNTSTKKKKGELYYPYS